MEKEIKLSVHDLKISFRTDAGKVQAVRNISFDLYKGETLAIVGESGSGKSVTNRAVMGILAPNAIGTLITSCALVIPSMIYSEVNLSYLNIINLSAAGISSVGTLIAAGQQVLSTAPHIALFPSLFLALMMLSFNLFGNGLRDAFNPSLRGSD